MAILRPMDEEAPSKSHDNHHHDLSAAAETLAMATHHDHRRHHRHHREHSQHRHHHNSQQPRAVLLVAYPVQVSVQPARASRHPPPALLPTTAGAPVAQGRPDNHSDDDRNFGQDLVVLAIVLLLIVCMLVAFV